MMQTYEQALSDNTQWASREGSMHFEGSGAVHETLKRVSRN